MHKPRKDAVSLAAFFPSVSTLGGYMDALVAGGGCAQADDPADYQRFLHTTLVGHGPIASRLAYYAPVEDLADTVLKVIRRLLSHSASGSSDIAWRDRAGTNTLALGFSLRHSGRGMNHVGNSGVVNHHVNSSVVELSNGRWARLLARTGTEAMAHLLYNTSVFLPLLNGGYYQISGVPLAGQLSARTERIEAASGTFRLGSGAGSRKRQRTEAGDADVGSDRRKIRKTAGTKGPRPAAHARANQHLELSSINIRRGGILFSSASPRHQKINWALSPTFCLNQHTSGRELVRSVFSRTRSFAAAPPQRLVELADRMLRLHKRFNYRLRLFRICPAPWQQNTPAEAAASDSDIEIAAGPLVNSTGRNPAGEGSAGPTTGAFSSSPSSDPPSVLGMACDHKRVYLFVQKCVSSVIPRELIGGRHNHRRLYTLLQKCVSAGRFEKLTLHEAVQRFRLREVPSWLDSRLPDAMDIYAGVIHWILSEYVTQLIAKFFYVTECSSARCKLLFFRCDVWISAARSAWKRIEETDMYVPTSYAQVARGEQEFGHSRIRLLPKERGFRTIVSMKNSFAIKRRWHASTSNAPGNFIELRAQSTNTRLAEVLAALRPWCAAHPELFGSAASKPSDRHARLAAFKAALQSKPGFGTTRLFMAKLDIHHAFDTIPQATLLELLAAQLPSEEMIVRRYWEVMPTFSRFRTAYRRHGQPSSDTTSFSEIAQGLSARSRGIICGDQPKATYLHTKTILDLIRKHVTQNTVKSHSGLLRQQRGIPQGSVLSPLLCDFFYGQLERKHTLPWLDPQSTLVMRVVDDFLIVSRDQAQVAVFVERLHASMGAHGCRLNKAKTLANFWLEMDGQRVKQTESSSFPWCGMILDDRTLDVTADYSRLGPPLRISDTLSVDTGKDAGVMLRQKMLLAICARLQPLYIDSSLNSRDTVVLNLYQNFVVCAMKFHTIYKQLPVRASNHRYCTSVVEETMALAYILLKHKCKERWIPSADVKWLGAQAFCTVLRRKQTRYTWLLQSLKETLHGPGADAAAGRYAHIVASPRNQAALSIHY
ncbi:Telomerase reverse transcriptase [Coemansia sp. RSA 552]|nr:Telomerase reverse transcriptase [Coemansia sp. RSA 552]